MKNFISISILSIILIIGCQDPTQKETESLVVKDQHVNVQKPLLDSLNKSGKVYVPVYSNIYQRTRNERTSLTSTLSIHNTSETDTLFITRLDYFNTEGKLVKKYLESPIYLDTFQTMEYVVDEADESGGSGANFVIEWYGDKKLNPLFQAVMIGGLANKSFSFTTNGVPFEGFSINHFIPLVDFVKQLGKENILSPPLLKNDRMFKNTSVNGLVQNSRIVAGNNKLSWLRNRFNWGLYTELTMPINANS